MDYYQFTFYPSSLSFEILLAFLSDANFDGFEETDTCIYAYISNKLELEKNIQFVNNLEKSFPLSWKWEKIPELNWNKIWEENFQPVLIANYCRIRADFHPQDPKTGILDIVINPEMAFGTGHHATTSMMISAMKTLEWDNKNVLDFGCGTGILSIVASKLGSGQIISVDYDEKAVVNTRENLKKNNVTNVQVFSGSLEDIPESRYDIILANINRSVIIKYLENILQEDEWICLDLCV